mmetsp:Transcript_66822/g.199634  ORF Transcript_66822/g.199634 Transcript_66822/m.199634 type:complete len:265 (+) Transcript_66822:942-1736(+)
MVLATIVAAIVLPSADTASGDGADDEARAKEEPLTKSTSSSFEEATDQVEEEEERTTQEIPIVAALLAIVLANFANGTWAVEPLFLKEFFGWGPNEFTAILMIYNVGLLTAQLLVVVPATKLLGLRNVGLLSCSLLSLGRLAMVFAQSASIVGIALLSLSILCDILGYALLYGICSPLLTQLSHPKFAGTVLMLGQIAMYGGTAFAPAACASLYGIAPGLTWWGSAAVVGFGGLLFFSTGWTRCYHAVGSTPKSTASSETPWWW